MIPVFLAKVRTRDGITLDGLYVRPKRKSKIALIWIHGLTSRFYSGQTLIKELSLRCRNNGIGYFKFNTRGHDVVTRDGKYLLGTAFEKFTDCVLDLKTLINRVKKLGYKRIVLAGHSTGANKALYYLYKTRDRRVKGLILLGALSDIAVGVKEFGPKKFREMLVLAKKLKQKSPYTIMPDNKKFFTAQRFLSLFRSGSAEDVFPYHNPRARWKELKSIRVPLAVIIGSRDEYLDRPAKNLIEVFKGHTPFPKLFSGIIIKGARHSFVKKEGELAKIVVNWIKRII